MVLSKDEIRAMMTSDTSFEERLQANTSRLNDKYVKEHSPSTYSKVFAKQSDASTTKVVYGHTDGVDIYQAAEDGATVHEGIENVINAKDLQAHGLTDTYQVERVMRTFNLVPELQDFDKVEAEVNVQGMAYGLRFKGQADLIIHNDDGTITVADAKNYKEVTEMTLETHLYQLRIYAQLIATMYNKPIKDIKVIYNRQNVVHTEVWNS